MAPAIAADISQCHRSAMQADAQLPSGGRGSHQVSGKGDRVRCTATAKPEAVSPGACPSARPIEQYLPPP